MRRTKTGVITSTKMQGTITVKVTEYLKDAKYGKKLPVSKKFHAHVTTTYNEGETVTIQETTPRSKTVCWEVVNQTTETK